MKLYTLIFAACAVIIAFTACKSSKSATAANSGETQQAKLEANKKLVAEFYQSLFGDKDSTAIDKYAADNIKQHNPSLQDGKEWLKNALRPFLENPNILQQWHQILLRWHQILVRYIQSVYIISW